MTANGNGSTPAAQQWPGVRLSNPQTFIPPPPPTPVEEDPWRRQTEERFKWYCRQRNALAEDVEHYSEPTMQAGTATGVRHWGPDLRVSTWWRGAPEQFHVDVKSPLQYRPGPDSLSMSLTDSAIIGLEEYGAFRRVREDCLLFGFQPIGDTVPYVGTLAQARKFCRPCGDYYWVNVREAGFISLDYLLGAPAPPLLK